jgi:hypothetical protein
VVKNNFLSFFSFFSFFLSFLTIHYGSSDLEITLSDMTDNFCGYRIHLNPPRSSCENKQNGRQNWTKIEIENLLINLNSQFFGDRFLYTDICLKFTRLFGLRICFLIHTVGGTNVFPLRAETKASDNNEWIVKHKSLWC